MRRSSMVAKLLPLLVLALTVPACAQETAPGVPDEAGFGANTPAGSGGKVIRDLEQRTGRVIDSQDDVGGYPTVSPTRHKLRIPADIDTWLATLARDLE